MTRTVLATEDSRTCEVCELLHRPDTQACDRCGHALGTDPDWEGMKTALPRLRLHIVLALLVVVAMLALNLVLFQGVGFIIALAPLGWLSFSIYRHHVLRGRLLAAGRLG